MSRIHVLSDLLVNKIAAGEVIERPASVVKELVENSLDAGARRIEVAIEEGGRRLIRVTDDGCGMEGADLALCVRPHATSKIRDEQDLFRIATMGFRGEALPSIGAVSQLRLLSRTVETDEAGEVRVTGDRLEPVRAAAGAVGTTVEVRELFFNVPARQKFLRTAQTEMGHITEQIARIGLVHPEVEFRLTHNGRQVHHLRPATGMQTRIADVYGRELADGLLEVSRAERGFAIRGYAARPAESRSSSKWQYLFLNGRFIRDRFVAHAVREAYRGLIESHRCPVVFLAFEIDPDQVDVNVHPTKIEVRWRNSNQVYTQVLSALRDRFLNADLTPALNADRTTSALEAAGGSAGASLAGTPSSAGAETAEDEARRQQIRASIASFFKRAQPITGGPPSDPGQGSGAAGGLAGGRPTTLTSPPVGGTRFESSPGATERAASDSTYRNVMQVHRAYLVAETDDGLMIVDQHALHERVMFEELSAQMARGPLESQGLLIEETIDVSPDHVEVIETHADTIRQLGFELTAGDSNAIRVRAVPSLLKEDRVMDFLRDLLDRLAARDAPASPEMLMHDLVSMMACKAAVKAGDVLSPDEIHALMARRHDVERSSNCPHGRPTSLQLSMSELEKQFKRT